LFRRGIAESVPAFLFGMDLATDVATVIAGELGRRPTVADLAEVPPQQLADAIDGIAYQDRWGYGLRVRRSQFGPVIDGTVLRDSPFRALAAGARGRWRNHISVRILFRRIADPGRAHHRDPTGVRHPGFAGGLSAVRVGAWGRGGVARNDHCLAVFRQTWRSRLASL
jgi:hypothetical protein